MRQCRAAFWSRCRGALRGLAKSGMGDDGRKREVGVAVADFPGMIGVVLRGNTTEYGTKHRLLYAEGEVVRLGLSEDQTRPAMKIIISRAASAFEFTAENTTERRNNNEPHF